MNVSNTLTYKQYWKKNFPVRLRILINGEDAAAAAAAASFLSVRACVCVCMSDSTSSRHVDSTVAIAIAKK